MAPPAPARERLADPETTAREMSLARRWLEPADPSAARVVGAMPAERVMHPIDELERELEVPPLSGRA